MINVLCLHGCRQSDEDFRNHNKDLIRIAKSAGIRLHFISAPYDHEIRGKSFINRDPGMPDEFLPEFSDLSRYDRSLEIIYDFIIRNDITCLLGFSEGACIIDTILRTKNQILTKITRCVLMNGTSFGNVPSEIANNDISILSVISENDAIVTVAQKPIYDPSVKELVLRHDRGHNIPRTKEQRIIIGFISGSDNLEPFYSH